MVSLEIEKICRVCLQADECLTPLFDDRNTGNGVVSLADMISKCTRYTASRHDGHPQNICFECIARLRSSFSFQKLYETSHRRLMSFLGSIDDLSVDQARPKISNDKCVQTEEELLYLCEALDKTEYESVVKTEMPSSEDESEMEDSKYDVITKLENDQSCNTDSKSIDLKKDEVFIKMEKVSDIESETDESNSDEDEDDNFYPESQPMTMIKAEVEDYEYMQGNEDQFSYNTFVKEKEGLLETSNAGFRKASKKEFSCNYCGRAYHRLHLLQMHVSRLHTTDVNAPSTVPSGTLQTTEKPFKCDQCPKAFKAKQGLKQHLICHSSERSHQCPVCKNNFARPAGLKNHMITHIECSKERPFPCTECDLRFKHNYSLKKHMRIHSGQKPFTCQFCGKGFVSSFELKVHERVHTGERPFQCPLCPKKYTRAYGVKKHMRRRHAASARCEVDIKEELINEEFVKEEFSLVTPPEISTNTQ